MFYEPVRLRTIARFSAADPWSGNLLTDYSITEYVMMPVGSPRALDKKWNQHAIGIQWESDARYRLLPEGMVELWRGARIPAEKLPWLLHAIEPRLIETDCLITQPWQTSFGLPLLAVMLICPVVCLLIRVNGQRMPAAAAMASGLGLALLTGVVLWIMKSSKRNRMKQQMTWALDVVSGKSGDGSAAKVESPFAVFFRLSIWFGAILIGVTLLVACGAAVYFKLHP